MVRDGRDRASETYPKPVISGYIEFGLSPAEMLLRLASEGHSSSGSLTTRGNKLEKTFDSLVSQGLVQLAEVYFSVDRATRDCVEEAALTSERPWQPGQRAGLLRSLMQSYPHLDEINLKMCLRYGPLARLSGDLYMLVRSYELLLSGLLRGVLVAAYGADRDAWFRRGVPAETRADLAHAMELQEADEPWQMVTFGTMSRVLDFKANRMRSPEIFGQAAYKSMKSDVHYVGEVRNKVMHPVRGQDLTQDDFERALSAVKTLRGAAVTAVQSGQCANEFVPRTSRLMIPQLIRDEIP